MIIITAEEARTQTAFDYTTKIQRRMDKIASDNKVVVTQIMNKIRAACDNGDYFAQCNVEINWQVKNDIVWFLTQCGYEVTDGCYDRTVVFTINWRKDNET